MAVTTTTAANAIREFYAPGYDEAVWRNNYLLGLFPEPVPSGGDTSYRWKVNSAGNDSVEVYTENLPAPDPGNQTWSNLAVAYPFYRGYLQATGHAAAALKSNWIPAIDEDAILLRGDLIDLITTSTMSAAAYGLEVAVDSSTTYAGQARGAAAWHESSETAVSDAVAVTDYQDLREVIRDNDKGGLRGTGNIVLLPENQVTRYYNLSGVVANQNIGDADKSPALGSGMAFAGMPLVGMPDWTDTVIMFLDMRPGKFVQLEHVPWTVDFQGRSADSDVYQVKVSRVLIDKWSRFDGKMTACTA